MQRIGARETKRHATAVLEDVPDGWSVTGLRYISKTFFRSRDFSQEEAQDPSSPTPFLCQIFPAQPLHLEKAAGLNEVLGVLGAV